VSNCQQPIVLLNIASSFYFIIAAFLSKEKNKEKKIDDR
jgi:hypothetical protein